MLWVFDNNDGRRNIQDFQRVEIALKRKDVLAAQAKERQVAGENQYTNKQVDRLPQEIGEGSKQNKKLNETATKVAEYAGVSPETVRKVEKVLNNASEEIIEKARSGEMKPGTAYRVMQEELGQTNRSIRS